MFEKGANYSLFRIRGAGKKNCVFERIDDVASKVQLGEILPNPIALQV